MKVLVDNYKKANTESPVKVEIEPYPRKYICEDCRSELEYEKSDLRMGALGCMYLDCPCCGYENMLEENEDAITLTVDNIEFPTHFWRTSTETGAVDICNNVEVKERIRNAVKYFRKNPNEYAYQTQCGNLFLVVFRWDGDESYEVILTKDYYHTYILFESEDYFLNF